MSNLTHQTQPEKSQEMWLMLLYHLQNSKYSSLQACYQGSGRIWYENEHFTKETITLKSKKQDFSILPHINNAKIGSPSTTKTKPENIILVVGLHSK
jgi:hypothetical protein